MLPDAALPIVEPFPDYVTARRAEIDAELLRVLPRAPECPSVVAAAMRYSVTVGGKRFRPILTLAAADAIAATRRFRAEDARRARELAMPAACAIELIHTYSLVHDDLPAMDNDDLRRGQPTLHVVYGDGLAILAGDGLLAEAFALLASEPSSDGDADLTNRKLRVLRTVGHAVGGAGMVGGQALDLEAAGLVTGPDAGRTVFDEATLRDMHARKTGLLIRAAAVAGAIMAGASAAQVEAIDRYAADVGLVFQIVDDILDVEGTSGTLGKTAGKDAAAGKPTYPAVVGLERSRVLAADGLARAEHALTDGGIESAILRHVARWVADRQC